PPSSNTFSPRLRRRASRSPSTTSRSGAARTRSPSTSPTRCRSSSPATRTTGTSSTTYRTQSSDGSEPPRHEHRLDVARQRLLRLVHQLEHDRLPPRQGGGGPLLPGVVFHNEIFIHGVLLKQWPRRPAGVNQTQHSSALTHFLPHGRMSRDS